LKVLLDENFPLALLRSLLTDGQQAEHIITMGWRGASDKRIHERLLDPNVLFMTQDEDFLLGKPTVARVVISRVKQSRRLDERVQIWRQAIHDILAAPRPESLFELMDDGRLLPWDQPK
jgi:hypothetical protein